jgi:hypothetical protein
MVLWSVALYATGQTTTHWNYLFNVGIAILFFSGGFIAISQARKSKIKSSVDHELITIGLGVTLFGIGISIWSYYNLVLNVELPLPSFSDLAYVLYAPVLGYGLVNLLKVSGAKITKRTYLEFLAIFAVAATLILTLISPPDFSSDLSFLTKFLYIYYPLTDSALVALGIIMIRLTWGKLHNSFFYFFIALFSLASADLLYSYRALQGTYYNGDITDVFYAFTGLMFTLGIIRIVATQAILEKYFPESETEDKLS